MTRTELINETQSLVSAKYEPSGYDIPTYDDGFGTLWVLRDTMGILGICRARSWEDAYGIAEDEFFPEADESIEDLIKEYGFRREHKRVLAEDGSFLRWDLIETPDTEAWSENELFQESYGFRPNGPSTRDKRNHGIYVKDLNGESLNPLTAELLSDLRIVLTIEEDVE